MYANSEHYWSIWRDLRRAKESQREPESDKEPQRARGSQWEPEREPESKPERAGKRIKFATNSSGIE